MKIKKGHNSKIVIGAIAAMFVFSGAIYAAQWPCKSKTLRVPIENYEYKRMKETLLDSLFKMLSSDDPEEMDRGLEALKAIITSEGIFKAEDLLHVIEKTFASRKALIMGIDKKIGVYQVLIIEQNPTAFLLAGWDFFDYKDKKTLSFSFPSGTAFDTLHNKPLAKRLEEESRLVSLAYWWLALLPGFQERFPGWRITADGIDSVTAKALLLHSPFKNIKIVPTDGYYFKGKDPDSPHMVIDHAENGRVKLLPRNIDVMEGIKTAEEIQDGKRYDFVGEFPEVKKSTGLALQLDLKSLSRTGL